MNLQNKLWAVLLLGALLLGGWMAYTGANRAVLTPLSNAETMLQMADKLYSAAYSATVQHSGPYRRAADDDSFAALGNEVAAGFGLSPAKPVRDANGHRVYSTSGTTQPEGWGKLEVALSGWADGSTNLIVRLDAPAGTEKIKLLAWTTDSSARLEKLGIQGKWMITLRGGAGAWSEEALKALKGKVTASFKAEPVDSYKDSSSEIISYNSKLLEPGIRSAAGTINLQAAFHRDSVYGTYRLTIATPLIISEP